MNVSFAGRITLLSTFLVLCGLASRSTATLLVYEPFNYTTGTVSGSGVLLSGQSGGTGMTGSWSTFNTGTANSVTVYQQGNLSNVNFNTGAANQFDGTVSNLVTSGGYFGSRGVGGTSSTTDHMQAWRGIDPSVTATFIDGSTTWFSFVSARAFNLNASGTRFAIGAAELKEDRGHLANGQAIGVGGALQSNLNLIHAQVWDDYDNTTTGVYNIINVTGQQIATSSGGTTTIPATDRFYWEIGSTSGTSTVTANSAIPNIVIGKIVWSDSSPDVISFAEFHESDGPLTEAAFNSIDISSAGWSQQVNLNQSAFDTISFAGARYFADELRIATTFNEVIGLEAEVEAVPEPSTLVLSGLGILGISYVALRKKFRRS